jgi:hypothetical protein
VPTSPRSPSRFDRLPAWQRAGILSVTVLVICVVLLLGAEAAVRIRDLVKHGNFCGIDETYEIDPATGLRIPVPNGHFGPIHINSFGFRGPAIAQKKSPGGLRIAFLGGSTTFCGEVSSDAMTWPALVQKALHERWPGLSIDYINAGVPGYTIRSLLPALEKRVAQFKPDIIVIYEAVNDLSANSYDLAHEQGVAPVSQEENIGWLSRHSLLAYLVGKNIEVMRLQREAADSSSKIKLDMPRLSASFVKITSTSSPQANRSQRSS